MRPRVRDLRQPRNRATRRRAKHPSPELRPLPFSASLVVAHRGGRRSGLPENSLAAFDHAIRCGAHMIEFDVRRTRDGVIVIHHDARVRAQLISRLDHAALRVLAPGVPTLHEVVQHCGGRVLFDVELKEAGYEPAVTAILRQRLRPTDLVVTSFLDAALAGMGEAWPEVRRGLLIGGNRLSSFMPYARLRRCEADFLAPTHLLLRLGVRRGAARRGVPLVVWTVNGPRVLRRLTGRSGIAGIITDDPVVALQLGEGRQSGGRSRPGRGSRVKSN